MKILFIKPPNVGFYHEIERYYPVGLAYLAAASRDAGHEVRIFDSLIYTEDNCVLEDSELSEGQLYKKANHPKWTNLIRWGAKYERIIDEINSFKPDIVSITAMHSPMYDTAYKIAEIVKEINPKIKVLLGGSHGSIAYEHVMKYSKADYVLQGEGEKSIVDLLECIEGGIEPKDVDGIVYKINVPNEQDKNGEIQLYVKKKEDWILDLDKLSFPAADLLEIDRYEKVTIITSRGCPFTCNFCTVHPTVGRRHRYRSPENVIEEIEYYVNKFGIKEFNIEDDNFTLNFDRANKILDLLIEKKFDISFNLPNGITAINIDEELVRKLVKLNLKQSFIGLETTSDERLKKITKTFTSVDKVEEIVGWFKKYNSKIGASLVIGFPDQTLDEMIDDIVVLINRNIEFGTANPCYPIPMSTLYNECLEKNFISADVDFTYYDEFNFPLETDNFKRKDVYDIWSCSLVYDYYPEMLEIMKSGFRSSTELIQLFKELNYGEIIECEDGYYCIPNKKDTFTEKMKLSKNNNNSSVFVDDITGDVLENLFSLFIGRCYEIYQIGTELVPNGKTTFWITETTEKMSDIKLKFIEAIHNCKNKF